MNTQTQETYIKKLEWALQHIKPATRDIDPIAWDTIEKALATNKKSSLEQPAQEPVAWMKKIWCPELDWYDCFKSGEFAYETDKEGWTPLYTHPAPLQNEFAKTKSWQRLSDDEILQCMRLPNGWQQVARAIEQALKEKNHG